MNKGIICKFLLSTVSHESKYSLGTSHHYNNASCMFLWKVWLEGLSIEFFIKLLNFYTVRLAMRHCKMTSQSIHFQPYYFQAQKPYSFVQNFDFLFVKLKIWYYIYINFYCSINIDDFVIVNRINAYQIQRPLSF